MTLSTEIINVLEFIGDKFGIAIDWTQANAMPYLQELMGKYISWEIATSWMWIIGFGILAVLCLVFGILDFVKEWTGVLGIIGIILGVSLIVAIAYHIHTIITCYYFPEMQIIKYIQTLLQNGG